MKVKKLRQAEKAREDMQKFELSAKKNGPLRILCLGAHSDDIEIGCGGTMLRLLAEHPASDVRWVVLGSSGRRNGEAAASAKKFLAGAKRRVIDIEGFEDGFFPFCGADLKKFFEKLKKRASPDLIFTHSRHDLHQDHRLVSELTWQTFRDHLILEYEVVKYDGDLGSPNFYVPLSAPVCKKKIDYLMSSFPSQKNRDWFTPDAFLSILRIRGIEARAAEKYAEAFTCRKIVV